METRIVNGLRYIKVDESAYSFQFDQFQLIKGGEFLNNEIFTQNFVSQAGLLASREFINYPFIYTIVESDPDQLPQLATESHSKLNQFLFFLWLVKDCSVNTGNLYCYIPNTDIFFSSTKLASYSNSKGYFEEKDITLQDLEYAKGAYQQFNKLCSNVKLERPNAIYSERPVINDSDYHFVAYNKNSRIERALSFLTMARTNSFLPLKISLCMSFLECLFTTDRQEVTHKVCERVSLYMGDSYESKQRIYNDIKSTYDIRSSFFHGQEIEKKRDAREKLEIYSNSTDTIIRDIVKKILFEDYELFNSSDEKRKEFFNHLVFD